MCGPLYLRRKETDYTSEKLIKKGGGRRQRRDMAERERGEGIERVNNLEERDKGRMSADKWWLAS